MTATGAPDLSSLFNPSSSERAVREQARNLKETLEGRGVSDTPSNCLALVYLSIDVTDESALGNNAWDNDQGGRQHRIFADECLS